jgi:predicted PurR-regulated permease PerM
MAVEGKRIERGRAVSIVLLGAAVGLLCAVLVRPFWKPIGAALVLAIVFSPLHRWIGWRVSSNTASALAATILVVAMVLVPALLLGTTVVREAKDTYASLQSPAGTNPAMNYVMNILDTASGWIGRKTGMPPQEVRAAIVNKVQEQAASLVKAAAGLVTSVITAAVGTVVTFFTLFFLFKDRDQLVSYAVALLPLEPGQLNVIYDRIASTMIANLYAIFAVAVAQGALAGLAFWVLGMPSPVLWGLATAIFSVVPVIGSAGVWIPASLILLSSGAWGQALAMLLWGACVIGVVDNFLRPLVIGSRTKLHPLLIFFSLLGGVRAFGALGLFFGPMIVSLALALVAVFAPQVRDWRARKIQEA